MKTQGFVRIQKSTVLDRDHSFWGPTIPRVWPQRDNLLARHPVPLFLANATGPSVAIVNANGISHISKRLNFTISVLAMPADAIGIVLDADDQASPEHRFDALKAEITRKRNSR